jgi:hypothetical protein
MTIALTGGPLDGQTRQLEPNVVGITITTKDHPEIKEWGDFVVYKPTGTTGVFAYIELVPGKTILEQIKSQQ